MTLEEYWEEQNSYYDSLPVHYSVWWDGYVFDGDSDEYNHMNTESYDEAMRLFEHFVSIGYDKTFHFTDNQYDYSMYYNRKTGEYDVY